MAIAYLGGGRSLLKSKRDCINWALFTVTSESAIVINVLMAAVTVLRFVIRSVNNISEFVTLNKFADYWQSID